MDFIVDDQRGELMRSYKLIALIISGVCVILFVIIGMNVFGLNNKDDGYNVDSNYVSINEQEKESSIVVEVKKESKVKVKPDLKEQIISIGTQVEENQVEEAKEVKKEKEDTKNNKVDNKEIVEINNKGGSNLEVETVEVDATDIINSESKDEEKAPTKYTGNNWVDEKIVENKDQISDKDLQSGLAIGDKIDTDLVMAYLEDGLTDEERESLKAYLNTVLSDSEYQTVKVLIGRYSSMVD